MRTLVVKNKSRNTVIVMFILYTMFLFFCYFAYQCWHSYAYTHDNYKWIDLRKEWPTAWVQAKFVAMGMYNDENLIIEIPQNKLIEFQTLLEHEIKNSPKMNNPQWNIYQLRIITIDGKYATEAMISEDKVFGNSWESSKLREWIFTQVKN